jgi:quercetin 2,3-dioxygenase
MANPHDPAEKATFNRRALLLGGTSLGLGSALGACQSGATPGVAIAVEPAGDRAPQTLTTTAAAPIMELVPLGAPPWRTFDPFLFCVHHKDDYPAGNAALGPTASLAGRSIGQDFAGKDGWNMYHGDAVPGFPRHPHRGFETVTITRKGYVDHSDSLGATARYGEGDVQWMTAGSGIVHAEMFPLLDERAKNPAELFQIWLNLPARSKFARPHFSMFWNTSIPVREFIDSAGQATRVTVIAGSLEDLRAPAPPPDSWASQPTADVAIWSIRMAPGARWRLPAAAPGTERTLYFFTGSGLQVAGQNIPSRTAVRLGAAEAVAVQAGDNETELLLLGGRPIGEPVVKHGPFVMNHRSEIEQAVRDYQRTQFGGWPWAQSGPVHVRDSGRFAVHADGRKERGV